MNALASSQGEAKTVSLLLDVVVQLAVATIAFLLGVSTSKLRSRWAYFRARRFWRPLTRRGRGPLIVLGDGFENLRIFEATDVIGRGDLVASYELISHFTRIGFRKLDLVFADRADGPELNGESLRQNMILIGGYDANSITEQCVNNMNLAYRLVWRSSTTSPTGDVPWLEATPGLDVARSRIQPVVRDQKVEIDYGVIIRAKNPYDYDSQEPPKHGNGSRVVIFYGCYGYGTLAAVLYSQTKEFQKMIKDTAEDIECVVACRVHDKTPQAVSVACFRSGAHGSMYVSSNGSNGSDPAESS